MKHFCPHRTYRININRCKTWIPINHFQRHTKRTPRNFPGHRATHVYNMASQALYEILDWHWLYDDHLLILEVWHFTDDTKFGILLIIWSRRELNSAVVLIWTLIWESKSCNVHNWRSFLPILVPKSAFRSPNNSIVWIADSDLTNSKFASRCFQNSARFGGQYKLHIRSFPSLVLIWNRIFYSLTFQIKMSFKNQILFYIDVAVPPPKAGRSVFVIGLCPGCPRSVVLSGTKSVSFKVIMSNLIHKFVLIAESDKPNISFDRFKVELNATTPAVAINNKHAPKSWSIWPVCPTCIISPWPSSSGLTRPATAEYQNYVSPCCRGKPIRLYAHMFVNWQTFSNYL